MLKESAFGVRDIMLPDCSHPLNIFEALSEVLMSFILKFKNRKINS